MLNVQLLSPRSLSEPAIRLVDRVLTNDALWYPLPGPQVDAYLSPADELFYGGAAGGGKSDLVLGLAVTEHRRSVIFRREGVQLSGPAGLIERSREIIGRQGRYNGLERAWRDLPGGRAIEFGACQYDRDKHAYQGRPHDFIAFDEISEFSEGIFRFLVGWLRTTEPGQRCRVICTGNPPSHADGEWVIQYWGPWLDEHHPNPAQPGELRWFAVLEGKSVEVDGPEPFEHQGQSITPRSRTFIPARLSDNPYLSETDYGTVLNNLPEPLRSQLLYGDFTIGLDDNPWQVIPTEWVRAAFQRWEQREAPDTPLSALGVDVARGGNDKFVIAPRRDTWFGPLVKRSGREVPDGPTGAALVATTLGDESDALVNVDVIGVGASVYDQLAGQRKEDGTPYNVFPVNFSESTSARDRSGMLAMRNIRAEAWWAMREALDPVRGDNLALPPDRELLADLVTPQWKISASGIQIESKDEIKKRLGCSPDCGDAVVLANYGTYGSWMTLL